ncbi:MAG TPA: glycosyltransferase family protein [Cyclobacteriaceae bacterium]|nr:glycosyltransferase family protein [Cyclobacteriaceae bacterium]
MITAIIQARVSSTRLPGKILAKFSGNSLLGHIIDRISYSKFISQTVVATTTNPADDVLVEWLKANQIPFFRGDETNVLSRYLEAAKKFNATHIARITSDDPFKDPEIIDAVASLYLNESLDFAYNNKPPSFAEGLDTEIFSFQALSRANKESNDPFEKEHVTQFFYRNPEKFKQKNLLSPVDFSHLRWTIDTLEDMAMAKAVYEALYKPGKIFHAKEILALIEKHPEIAQINQSVKRSDMYKK